MLVKKKSTSGFTLTELIVSIILLGLIILASSSAEIASRQFFNATEEQVAVQDEAKIAMHHMVKYISQGVGSLDSPGYTLYGNNRIRVRIDGRLTGVTDGRYTGAPNDATIEYEFDDSQNVIIFDPNADDFSVGDKENLTLPVIANCHFLVGGSINQIEIQVVARENPSQAESPDNPQITLDSSVVLRAMSCN